MFTSRSYPNSGNSERVFIFYANQTAVVIIEELIRRKVDLIYVTDVHQKRVEDVRDHFGNQVR